MIQGQLSLFENKPGECEHESRVVDIGGGKSYCELMQCWTNCREVGHCVERTKHERGYMP